MVPYQDWLQQQQLREGVVSYVSWQMVVVTSQGGRAAASWVSCRIRYENGTGCIHTSVPESPSPGDGEFRAYAGSNAP